MRRVRKPRNMLVEAVSLTRRTFSFLHWLGSRVVTAKLQEMYALPHVHTRGALCMFRNTMLRSRYPTTCLPLRLSTEPKELRIIKSPFQIRIYALLGKTVHQPPPSDHRRWGVSQLCTSAIACSKTICLRSPRHRYPKLPRVGKP